MLFYTQIKREFTPTAFKNGQAYFRADQIQDVTLTNDKVTGTVTGDSNTSFHTTISMARGTVQSGHCSCQKPGTVSATGKPYCDHIAGVCIYIVERGSLLKLAKSQALKKTTLLQAATDASGETKVEKIEVVQIPGQPVALVRGLSQDRSFLGISIEAAVKYTDPDTQESVVKPLHLLVKQKEYLTWKTVSGHYIKLSTGFIPILESVEHAQMSFTGPTAIETLAHLLEKKEEGKQTLVLFHESVQFELDPEPLKLKSIEVGTRGEFGRVVHCEFRNSRVKFSSKELQEISKQGRLSSQYVLKGNTIYRLDISLSRLAQFANRSGVAAHEIGKGSFKPDGFAYLQDDAETPLHPLAVYRLSLELGVDDLTVDHDWREFHEWKKEFEKTKIAPLPTVDYGFELRDYQKNGLSWMWSLYERGLAALLADDMGLGKTHQVLAFLSCIYATKRKSRPAPTLVVAPTSVVAAWSQKLQKYPTGLRWLVFHGNGRVLPPDNDRNYDIVLTTYGILQREACLRAKDWLVIVLDEAQAIKNSSTISARASRALRCKYRIAMTGTPVENQSTDLWSVMEFLLPGYLGSLARFKRLYGTGRELPTPEQVSNLKKIVSPFLLRRTKSQVLKELPEKTEEILLCEMTTEQKRAYKEALNSAEAEKARRELESGGARVDYANILALLTKLKQICDHPRLPEVTQKTVDNLGDIDMLQSGKWETFIELIEEALGSALKIVVFTQYLGMMDLIGHELKKRGVGYTDLRGDTQDRGGRLEKFANDPDCKVFVCSLLAGGLGIDLTAGSVCIHMDRWWNPAKENQATDRLHRFGQTRGVQVFKLQISGTVEDRIASIIEAKTGLSGALIEESPTGLKSFSRQDLLDLLTTRF